MMYFMLFRPQQQRSKQLAKLMANLKAGDRVVTSSGIVGIVISVKDKTVSLRSADAKMEVTKSSVTEILESGDATSYSSLIKTTVGNLSSSSWWSFGHLPKSIRRLHAT